MPRSRPAAEAAIALLAVGALGAFGGVARADRRVAVTPSADVVVPRGPGPHPVAVVVHGWNGDRSFHDSLVRQLVDAGIAAVSYQAPDASELDPRTWIGGVRRALDAVEHEAGPGGRLAGRLDMNRVGIAGHSLGGATAIGVAATDRRIKSAVALAPGTHLLFRHELLANARKVRVPTLVVGASHDVIARPGLFARRIAAACEGCAYEEIRGGSHLGFTDHGFTRAIPTPFGLVRLGMPAREQLHEVNRRTVEHLRRTLTTRRAASIRRP